MIATRSLKEFVYLMPGNATGNATRERVAEIIAMIEGKCRIVDERVALCPEQNRTCQDAYPINISLPDGVVLMPDKYDRIVNSKPASWAIPSVESILRLAAFGSSGITAEVKKFRRTFLFDLSAISSALKVQVILDKARGMESSERIGCLRQMSEFLELPVIFGPEQNEVVHREKLHAALAALEPDRNLASMMCELSKPSFKAVFETLMLESKKKLQSWSVANHTAVPSAEWLSEKWHAEINRAQLPMGKAEIVYSWRLRSHQHYAAMMEMAKLNEAKGAAQSLFEFEFTGGKRGQLDLMAHTKTGFKLWFSFDAKDAQVEFTQLTGIKLKEWN